MPPTLLHQINFIYHRKAGDSYGAGMGKGMDICDYDINIHTLFGDRRIRAELVLSLRACYEAGDEEGTAVGSVGVTAHPKIWLGLRGG